MGSQPETYGRNGMKQTKPRLRRIYDKTDGQCEYCGKEITWTNYGKYDVRGGWHVDHSQPRSRGGTNHLNNLFPACIKCNLDKGDQPGRTYRNQPSRGAPTPSQGGEWILAAALIIVALYAIANGANGGLPHGPARDGVQEYRWR